MQKAKCTTERRIQQRLDRGEWDEEQVDLLGNSTKEEDTERLAFMNIGGILVMSNYQKIRISDPSLGHTRLMFWDCRDKCKLDQGVKLISSPRVDAVMVGE